MNQFFSVVFSQTAIVIYLSIAVIAVAVLLIIQIRFRVRFRKETEERAVIEQKEALDQSIINAKRGEKK